MEPQTPQADWMRQRLVLDDAGRRLLQRQLGLISVSQALAHGLTIDAVYRRCRSGGWRLVLPGVLLTTGLELTRDQQLMAAHLWSGEEGLVDGLDACVAYGLRDPDRKRELVQVALPRETLLRSTGFVVVRRTRAQLIPVTVHGGHGIEYVHPANAAVLGGASLPKLSDARALIAKVVQRRMATAATLAQALREDPPYRPRHLVDALDSVLGGARSEGEAAFRALARRSPVLPPLLYNCLLRLPDGRKISPDALAEDAGVVHETEGWRFHGADEDDFDGTQERRDALVDADFRVLANSPRQIRDDAARVIRQFENCYRRERGRGLPPGVTILRRGAAGAR